jgi:hypothetical protein
VHLAIQTHIRRASEVCEQQMFVMVVVMVTVEGIMIKLVMILLPSLGILPCSSLLDVRV